MIRVGRSRYKYKQENKGHASLWRKKNENSNCSWHGIFLKLSCFKRLFLSLPWSLKLSGFWHWWFCLFLFFLCGVCSFFMCWLGFFFLFLLLLVVCVWWFLFCCWWWCACVGFSAKYLDCIKCFRLEFFIDCFLVCYFLMISYRARKKTPRLNPWTALKLLTVKYCLSFPGAYVKWSGKTDSEEIMYFCVLSQMINVLVFLPNADFLQAERISISSIFL